VPPCSRPRPVGDRDEAEKIRAIASIGDGFDREEAEALYEGLRQLSEGSESYLVGCINQLQYRRGRPPAEVQVDLREHWRRARR
jgi:ATP-dependent DNA ligase